MSFILFVLLLKFVSIYGFHCSNSCCYQYQVAPTNVSRCTPQGLNLELLCGVYNPYEPFTNLTVNWYRSVGKDSAELEGELIENVTQKYVLTCTHTINEVSENSTSDAINFHYFKLQIINFSEGDSGYYWCQIVLNHTCLQPSAYGHVTINTSMSNSCTDANYSNINYDFEQSAPFCGNQSASCGATKYTTKEMTRNSTCISSKTFYSVTGSLLLIIVLLLLVIMVFGASYFSHNKKTTMPYNSKDKSESAALWPSESASGVQPAKVDTDDDFYDNREPVSGDNISTCTWSLSTVSIEETTHI